MLDVSYYRIIAWLTNSSIPQFHILMIFNMFFPIYGPLCIFFMWSYILLKNAAYYLNDSEGFWKPTRVVMRQEISVL